MLINGCCQTRVTEENDNLLNFPRKKLLSLQLYLVHGDSISSDNILEPKNPNPPKCSDSCRGGLALSHGTIEK